MPLSVPDEHRLILRQEVLERLIVNAPLKEILELIAQGVTRERPKLHTSILLVDASGRSLWHSAACGIPDFYTAAVNGLEIGEGIGSCGTAAFRRQRVVAADIATDPAWTDYRDLAQRAGFVACWSEPICDSKGRLLGTFGVYAREPFAPDASDIELINQAVQLASLVIVKSRAEEQLKLASSVFQASSEAITVTDENNRIIAVNPAFTRVTGYSAEEVVGHDPKILSSGRQGKAFYQAMWASLESSGQWQGEIWNRRKNGEIYAEWLTINAIRDNSNKIVRRIAMFSDLTERKRAEEAIWQQTNYDQLTGLPNRRLFRDRLQQDLRRAQRENRPLALMFIDLDRFRDINEAHGHDIGDALLVEAAQRIITTLRDSDTVSRFSGDEFIVTLPLPPSAEPELIERIAQSVLQKIAEPFSIHGEQAFISASIGIALYPDDADDVDSLMKSVDQALNAAKDSGVNHYCWFMPEMQAAARVRRQLIRDLRGALATGQLEVHYQPVVDLKAGCVTKAEALLRWRHPEHGMISPTQFIPLAEEVGVIVEIGDWVFREVAWQLHLWHAAGYVIEIAINKSPRQFINSQSHITWLAYLNELGVAPESLTIEITEGLLLDGRSEIASKLLAFRAAGVRIAIDDFGTGYSALSYLQKFSVDYLKIDRSFISDLTTDSKDRALADAIVVMAQKLGLRVVAEGVETEAQRDHLAEVGCDYIQGWFYGKAVPPAEFETVYLQNPFRR